MREPMLKHLNWTIAATLCAVFAGSAAAQVVKVTPLGGIDGEFCAQDRALVFEDPNGTRLLYDPGHTVVGGADPRLGRIDVVLLSHMHNDHLGEAHIAAVGAGTCAKPEVTVPTPDSNVIDVALAKKAKIVTGSEMPAFFAARLKKNGADPADSMTVRFGGSVTVGGVKIATVSALHSNGVDPQFIGGAVGDAMKAAGVAGDVGPATGYVLRFSNGLVAWLSGDTGIEADQERVVRDYYHARLAVMNMGDGLTTGPAEAAWVIDKLVKPASVIPSHANEAGTVDGKVRPGSKTEAFIKAVHVPAHVPLSGKTMEFDAEGRCVKGC